MLRRGGLCAIPTETVYGLAALAHDADAVARVFEAKGRPSDNPLIVHLSDAAEARAVARVTEAGARLLGAFAPGPLTVVLPARPGLPPAVTAGLDTVAVRVPASETARAVLRAAQAPLVAPSANRSGRPSPTTWQAVIEDLDGRIDAVLRGAPARVGLESTVVDATGAVPVVLRPGGVSLDALRAVLPATTQAGRADLAARSPGTRHRHYAPRAVVRIVEAPLPDGLAAWIGLDAPPTGYALAVIAADIEDYARRLFGTFRRADSLGLVRVDAQRVPEAGLGAALMDRLQRAAAR